MLRAVLLLVVVSACAPSAPSARAPKTPVASTAPTLAPERASDERGARLAPPFGRTAGVRRVSEAREANVEIVAAADHRE